MEKKTFIVTERIPCIRTEIYEIQAETEEDAIAIVKSGKAIGNIIDYYMDDTGYDDSEFEVELDDDGYDSDLEEEDLVAIERGNRIETEGKVI